VASSYWSFVAVPLALSNQPLGAIYGVATLPLRAHGLLLGKPGNRGKHTKARRFVDVLFYLPDALRHCKK